MTAIQQPLPLVCRDTGTKGQCFTFQKWSFSDLALPGNLINPQTRYCRYFMSVRHIVAPRQIHDDLWARDCLSLYFANWHIPNKSLLKKGKRGTMSSILRRSFSSCIHLLEPLQNGHYNLRQLLQSLCQWSWGRRSQSNNHRDPWWMLSLSFSLQRGWQIF